MVYVTIRNQGTVDVAYGNNFWMDFYVDQTPAPNLHGNLAWGVQGVWMSAGHSETFSGPYTFSGERTNSGRRLTRTTQWMNAPLKTTMCGDPRF